jgi:phosphate transport system ATP-binding protein
MSNVAPDTVTEDALGPSTTLETADLNVWFASNHVLHDISMSAASRSVTAVIGPSGCGKSTFLRTLNRMHDEVRGSRVTGKVMFDGHDVYGADTDAVALRRRIGMVFQRANPFPTMSVMDNAVAGLRLGGRYSRSELRERGESALRRAGLWDEVKERLSEPGGKLSGGQQQRLCIARALAARPEVLLLDEPCSALDPRSTAVIEELIVGLAEELAVVIVTHNLQQAHRIADRVAFMYLGELVECGLVDQVFDAPRAARTREYVSGAFG